MSLKKKSSVQIEIEKKLADILKQRFLDDVNDETKCKDFDEQDIEKFKKIKFYFHLFIRARQGDLEKAYEMMIESLKWRKSFKINDIKEDHLDKKVLEKGLLYYHSRDKNNHPLLIFHGNKYQYKDDRKNAEELEKVFAFLLEKQQRKHLGTKITVICDHHNASIVNMDLDFFKFVVNLFSIYYPNMLESFIVLDVSWRLSAIWKVIKHWLSNDMLSRFRFVEKAKLTEFVDKSNIIFSMGGEDMFQYTGPLFTDTAADDSAPSTSKSFYEKSSSQEDLFSGFEDEDDYKDEAIAEEISSPKGKTYSHSFKDKSMGGTLGTQVRHRFKDHSSGNDKEPSDEHIEENPFGLVIKPSEEIIFREVEHESEVQETLTLKNISGNTIIFKVKTNSAARFRVRPHLGALLPGSSKEIALMLLLKGDSNQEKQYHIKEKFLILFSELAEPITSSTDLTELWGNVAKIDINEHKLTCRVLDVNGLEKRPKTIDDVLEMSLKLKEEISQVDAKVERLNTLFSQMTTRIQQQTIILISGFTLLTLLLLWFR